MAETATLELPRFKGRAGWEFTELGDFTLEAWEAAPANGTAFDASHLLEPPAGAIELVQVDGASTDGVGDGELKVLPLSVARERHPELVEPHLGTIVRDVDAFTARTRSAGRAARSSTSPPAWWSTSRSCSPPSPRRPARSSTGAC